MKKTVETKKLKKQLNTLAKIVDRKPVLPILECVLIAENKITANNLSAKVVIDFPCEGAPIVVNLNVLKEAVRKSGAPHLSFTSDGETLNIKGTGLPVDGLNIACDGTPGEFPNLALAENANSLVYANHFPALACAVLGEAADYVSKDKMRPALGCVYLTDCIAYSSDTFRLYHRRFRPENATAKPMALETLTGSNNGLLLPKNIANLMYKIDQSFEMSIHQNTDLKRYVHIVTDSGINVQFNEVEEKPADFEKNISGHDTNESQYVVDTIAFRTALKQSEYAQPASASVVLTAKGNMLTLTTANEDMKQAYTKSISIDNTTGNDNAMTLNGTLLASLIAIVKEPYIIVSHSKAKLLVNIGDYLIIGKIIDDEVLTAQAEEVKQPEAEEVKKPEPTTAKEDKPKEVENKKPEPKAVKKPAPAPTEKKVAAKKK